MLQEVIKFRNLADSLTQTEFELLLSKLYNKFNKRQLILSSLFHLFNSQNNCNHDNAEERNCNVTKTMDIISSIIKSRDTNYQQLPVSKHQNKIMTISNLSSDIIGFCASYLNFRSYKSFEKCSRHIYISCNNPSTLQCIDSDLFIKNEENIDHLCKPQYLQLLKHKKVTHLEIAMDHYRDMGYLYDEALSSNVTNLSLIGADQESLAKFLSVAPCDFNKINNLQLDYYDVALDEDLNNDQVLLEINKYVDTFCDLFMKTKNIKCLDLRRLNNTVGTAEVFEKLVSKLKDDEFRGNIFNKLEGFCFSVEGTEEIHFYNELLKYFSDKLVTLHFDALIAAPINGFPKLRELCIRRANYSKIDIMQTAANLEKIHLSFFAEDINSLNQYNKNQLECILVELLNQKSLEYILININRDIDIILSVLKKINLQNRNEMRFFFSILQKSDYILEYINTLRDKLKINSNDYVLRMGFVLTENMLDVAKKIDIGYTVKQHPMGRGKFMDVVWRNDGCKLNGFRADWIYACELSY